MLRKLSAALLASALIAAPAFAAAPKAAADNAASTPAAATAPAKQAGKSVKHARSHVVRHKTGKSKLVRNSKSTKTHWHHIVAHNPAKPNKTSKTNNTSKMAKPSTSTHG